MRWVVLWAGLAACGSASAAEKISYGPAPDWVSAAAINATPAAAAQEAGDGEPALTFLETDSQSKFTRSDVSEFSAFKLRVNTAQGLPVGGFSRSWDPATDTLTIHRLRIVRDGQTIDVLRKQKFEILRREPGLALAMLDGRLTATLQIADLRVGDVIDFAMTINRAQPVLAGANSAMAAFPSTTKVGKTRVRYVWDNAAPLRWRAGASLPTPRVSATPGGGEMIFEAAQFSGPKPIEDAPSRFATAGLLEASQVDSWASVSRTFAPIFTRASTLAQNSPLKAEIERIRRDGKTPLDQASLALKLVEDQIRYVAILINAQGYTPAAADETWKRRFGDCKGKTALLIAILQELGIEAQPVLVSSFGGESVSALMPRATAFDHVIVRARVEGKDYWLDGTRSGDGPLQTLQTPDFGWVLPVTSQGAELLRLKPPRPERPTEQYTLRVDASKGFGPDTPIELEVIRRGPFAAASAKSMTATPRAQLEQSLIRRYDGSYPRARFTSAGWRYDADQGRIVYTLKGTMAAEVQVMGGRNRYAIPGSRIDVPDLRLRPKDQDQAIPYEGDDSTFSRNLTIVTLPDAGKDYQLFGGAARTVLGGVERSRWASSEDGVVIMARNTRGLSEEVSAEQMAKDVETAQRQGATAAVITSRADNAAAMSADGIASQPLPAASAGPLNVRRSEPADAAVAARLAALPEARRNELTAFMQSVGVLFRKQDYAGVLKALDTTKLDLSPFGIGELVSRVFALRGLKREAEAIALLDREIAAKPTVDTLLLRAEVKDSADRGSGDADVKAALALDPDHIGALYALGRTREVRTDPGRTVQLRRRIVALRPDTPEGWINLALAEATAGHPEESFRAIEDAREAGASGALFQIQRAEALRRVARADEALAALDLAVAARPREADVLNGVCWGRATIGRQLDKALGECEAAVKAVPTNAAYRDSLAFVKLRQGRFTEAVADYTVALKEQPTLAASLFGRGVARLRSGDAGGEADLASARKYAAEIDTTFAGYGVKP